VSPRVLDGRGDPPREDVIEEAARLLGAGRLLIYPTDTLYALGGRALDGAVAAGVFAAKGRETGKPLPLIAADEAQARALLASWPETAARIARSFWPGPLTLVLPASDAVPSEVTGGTGTLAVRVPALALARRLCDAAGPLIATSANRAGEPAPATCEEALGAVGASCAAAIDAGPLGRAPSTLVDVTGEPRLLRAGAVPWDAVRAVLR
jgi:L-threonylcarbamoyladenylate synthase